MPVERTRLPQEPRTPRQGRLPHPGKAPASEGGIPNYGKRDRLTDAERAYLAGIDGMEARGWPVGGIDGEEVRYLRALVERLRYGRR